jgi:hypothetical protein
MDLTTSKSFFVDFKNRFENDVENAEQGVLMSNKILTLFTQLKSQIEKERNTCQCLRAQNSVMPTQKFKEAFSSAKKLLIVTKNTLRKALIAYAQATKANVKEAQASAKRAQNKVKIAKVALKKAEKKFVTTTSALNKANTEDQKKIASKMFSDAQKALVVAKNAVKKALKSAKLNKRVAVKAEHNALVVYAKIAKANVKKAQEEAKRAEKKVTIAKVDKNKAEKKLKTLRATLLKDTTQEQLNVSVKKIEIAYKALNVAKEAFGTAVPVAQLIHW